MFARSLRTRIPSRCGQIDRLRRPMAGVPAQAGGGTGFLAFRADVYYAAHPSARQRSASGLGRRSAFPYDALAATKPRLTGRIHHHAAVSVIDVAVTGGRLCDPSACGRTRSRTHSCAAGPANQRTDGTADERACLAPAAVPVIVGEQAAWLRRRTELKQPCTSAAPLLDAGCLALRRCDRLQRYRANVVVPGRVAAKSGFRWKHSSGRRCLGIPSHIVRKRGLHSPRPMMLQGPVLWLMGVTVPPAQFDQNLLADQQHPGRQNHDAPVEIEATEKHIAANA